VGSPNVFSSSRLAWVNRFSFRAVAARSNLLGAVGSTPSGEVKLTLFGSGCSILPPRRWLSSLGTVGSGLRRGLRRPGLSLCNLDSDSVGSKLRRCIRRQGLLLRSSVGSKLRRGIRRQGLSLRGLRSLGVDSGLRCRLRGPRRAGRRPRRFGSLALRLWPSSPLLMGSRRSASGLRLVSCRRRRFGLGLRSPTLRLRRWAGPSLPCLFRARGASSFRLASRGELPLRRLCRDSVVNCRLDWAGIPPWAGPLLPEWLPPLPCLFRARGASSFRLASRGGFPLD